MVRPRNQVIWSHYRETENKSVTCKYCEKRYKIANLQKMTRHLLQCANCPQTCKQQLKGLTISAGISDPVKENIDPELENNSSAIENTSTPLLKRSMSDEEKQNLHAVLAKAIYVSGTPLSIVEHPLWIRFFDQLQPLYKLPTRKTLSTSILEKTYKNMYRDLKEELVSCKSLHLQIDGWSNCRNEGVINVLISKPEPVFIKSIATEENRHTGEYISEQIITTMSEYGAEKFSTLIGDNASNIQRAFRLVKEIYPHVTLLNCTAHTLHLLCRDIIRIPVINNFKDIAVHVIKAIKKSQVLTSLLTKIVKEKGAGETLKLPCDTRWGTYCTSFKSVENTKTALQTLAVHEQATLLPAEEKSALLDDVFWVMIKQCVLILEPMSHVIFTLESNEQNIYKIFITLKNMKSTLLFSLPEVTIIEDTTKDEILTKVDERVNMCLKPIHFAAYMLDPLNQGVELDQNQELDAVEYIHETGRYVGVNVMPDLASFRARNNYWGRRFLWENLNEISAVNWWNGICTSTSLSKVAIRILTAPCTSAAVERSFSAHSNIHSKKRNRLSTDRAAKITFISYNWTLLNKHREDVLVDDCNCELESSPISQSDTLINTPPRPASPQPSTSNSNVHVVEFLDCGNLPDSSDED